MTHPVLADNTPNGKSAVTGRSSATAPLVLTRPLGRTTWLGRVDGTTVTARLMVAAVPGPALLLPEPDQNLPSNLISFLGTYVLDGTGWAVSEYVPGTSLDRLLGMAILTPAQAAYVAAGIFAGLADLHAHGHVHGSLTARHVVIGNDGRPRLAGWALASPEQFPNLDAARIADLDAARAVVFELARNCDRPVGRHSPGGSKLLVDLERLGTGAVLADAQATAEHLTDRLDSAEGVRTGDALMRAELASLIRAGVRSADVGRERTAPIPKPQPARTQPKPVPPVPDAPLSKGNWLRRRRRGVLWAAVVVIVALAAAGFVAHKSISRLADRVLNGQSNSSSSTPPANGKSAKHATTTHHHKAKTQAQNGSRVHVVPVLAPKHAGLVREVALRSTAPCRLRGSCPVQVTVAVTPTQQAHQIAWRVVAVNRCTGARHIAAQGTMTVSANSGSAWDTPRLNLRARHGVAAIAVTSTPAHAASRPLLVPAHHISC
jgi:hypothetical protein